MPRSKPKKGMALLLVMAVIVVVLTTVSIGATVLLNNLDTGKSQEQTTAAFVSARSAIEKVRGFYKNDNGFFEGCSVNDCIDFYRARCVSCDAGSIFDDGNRRYKVVVMTKNAGSVSLQATGYKGLYNRVINDGIKFTDFTCGDDYSGLITDGEGNEYPTTEINGRCWMATSLRTKQKADGSCINGGLAPCPDASKDDDGLGRSCFDNDEVNCNTDGEWRGALYTWEAAMDGSNDEGAQGLCPVGWHIPTDKEWSDLETFLKDTEEEPCDSSRSNANGNEFECISAGLKLAMPDHGGGETEFNGIGTGYRDTDGATFPDKDKKLSKYWSSTGNKPSIIRTIDENNLPAFGRDEIDNKDYYSYAIRCLKDS